MSLRAIGLCAVSLSCVIAFARPAEAKKPCQCEVAVGCPKDAGHTTLRDFGAIARYRETESGKQRRCADACATRASAAAADLRADGEALCDRLGPGRHPVAAYSVVGHTDTRNNWCDPDDHIGTLICERVCHCPDGFTYDADSKLCLGTCGGRSVATFSLGCEIVARWQ